MEDSSALSGMEFSTDTQTGASDIFSFGQFADDSNESPVLIL